MKLAQSKRRALWALAGLAAIQAAPALAGDDKSTWTAMMEMVGASSDEGAGKIDYSERPRLVLPPSAGGLPSPRERAERSGDWPTELSSERRRNADRYARVPDAPPPEQKKGLLERIRGPRPAAAPGTDDEPGLLQRVLTARTRNAAAGPEAPPRRMLVEPPEGYRQPTKDLSGYSEKSGKSWWNPLSWGAGGNDNDPVAQTGNPNAAGGKLRPEEQGGLSGVRKLVGWISDSATSSPQQVQQTSSGGSGSAPQAQQTSSGGSGSWFQMPRFVQAPDDTK